MPEFRKAVKLSKLDYYKTHLSLANCLLPIKMTSKEIEVLANFMVLEGDIAAHRFGKTAKEIVRKRLGITPTGLSNYFRSLTNKRFLKEDIDSKYVIWPVLIPEANEQLYMFKLIKTEEDGTTNTEKLRQTTDQTNRITTAETSEVE
jgi:predicted transcriptional regulator